MRFAHKLLLYFFLNNESLEWTNKENYEKIKSRDNEKKVVITRLKKSRYYEIISRNYDFLTISLCEPLF